MFVTETGFTTTTLRQIRSLEKIVSLAESFGAQCIEWGGDIHVRDIASAQLAADLCKKAGIRINSYGSYYRAGGADSNGWEEICKIAAAMSCASVRIWAGKKDSEKTDEKTYDRLVADLKSMCDTAEKYSLAVCPECHPNTYNNNTDAFLRLRKDVDRDNFRTYFQSLYKDEKYEYDRIERTLPYIESVHLSYSEQRREQLFRQDPMYVDRLLDKLISSGFDGNIFIEYTYPCQRIGFIHALRRDMERLNRKVGKI